MPLPRQKGPSMLRFLRDDGGATVVEYAVILAVLFVIALTVFDIFAIQAGVAVKTQQDALTANALNPP